MNDTYGRKIKYLRLSVTDLCNYRCIYCMGAHGVCKKAHGDILSIEELTEIVRAAYSLGIRKIRLTGGEPLVRRGVLTLCRNIRAIADDIELSLTTNGSLLPQYAEKLKAAGVDRLNISLDTLDPETFRNVTRVGELQDVLDGIRAAQDAGFGELKINTVLLKGVNDGEALDFIRLTKDNALQVRFIELMPLGEVRGWDNRRFLSVQAVAGFLRNAPLERIDGVARVYRLPGHKGTVGLISPISDCFCSGCDRIRVTADGKLKPCLHSNVEIDLRGLHGEALKQAIADGILQKPKSHHLNRGTDTARYMNEIGG